jgi:hypothetical protein
MNGWQPIETAPRDGTWILALSPRSLPVCQVVRWEVEHPSHARPEFQNNYAMWAGYYEAHGPFDGPVTHWMPLPEPPRP